jgi:hypothetical protein
MDIEVNGPVGREVLSELDHRIMASNERSMGKAAPRATTDNPRVEEVFRWYARPERPNVRVHSLYTSWAGNRMIRVGYDALDPRTTEADTKTFWSVTPSEFKAIFTRL